ncbi:glycosyltransferase [Bacteroidales bacterium OttesenSCG-928-B11]|nr:glycosyltransferase [Bacteroidales bacterium OttesenSCG-928-E04]MDL2308383.1 glycosyltransferase [Bacteroidales bacterium OttesenSCG-928-C03]MDL2311789.1 glycosyltransferase [Bacteroidales bacterium OttesenSCG-928-B11]MDL2326206.1 glycosyltransferase [Bacteroidales bacterium OttesenSCG-928-A14]
MLSVLIPVYNWDVRAFVNELHRQLESENIPYEIVIEDDTSEERYHLLNSSLPKLPHTSYCKNEINLGRSKIRNSLISKSQYPYLLLMDCDAGIVSPDFIHNYIKAIRKFSTKDNFVISGGVVYRPEKPEQDYMLRWKYGRKKEEIPAKKRNTHPYKSFTPFNILATKTIFETLRFDETFSSYGHEDTVFGYQLQEAGVPLLHIDNPLFHDGLDKNEVYLQKIECAVENLIRLAADPSVPPKAFDDIRLYNFHRKLKALKLTSIYRLKYRIFKKIIRQRIIKKGDLICLDLYKLGKIIGDE